MFILEKVEGKIKTIVATATSREDAFEKVGVARENGIFLTVTEVIEDQSIFKERDYDAEFIELVHSFKKVTEKIIRFPLNKVKMSSKDYANEANAILKFDIDHFLLTVAKPHQLSLYTGEYGHGRELEWSTSNGVTTGEWVSSSSTC